MSKSKQINSRQILENKICLIEEIKGQVLGKTTEFLNNRGIYFDNILKFIKNPQKYPGAKNNLKIIIQKFIDDVISDYYHEIHDQNLTIKYVHKTVLKIILRGGTHY